MEQGLSPSILVILMGSIGDVARGLCIASQLKRAYPQCRLSWLVEPKCEGLVRSNRWIDEVFVFARNSPVRGFFELRRVLSERRFDICLDMQRHFKSGLFARLSGAARRVGFHPKNAKEGNALFQTEYIPYRSDDTSKLDHYLLFVSQLGIEAQRPFDFGLATDAEPEVVRTLRQRSAKGYCAIILGSTWKSKDWMPEGYQKLIEILLRRTELHVVLCGDRTQEALAQHLSSKFRDPRLVDTVGRTSLVELSYLLKGARGCVGPDSGPAHIAAAVGTKHVTLFGPTSAQRVAPFGSEHLSVHSSVGCSPCYRRECPGLNTVCMRLISADSVWQKLQQVLGEKNQVPIQV